MDKYSEIEQLSFTDEDIGEYLLNIITGGLYEEPHVIIREYIQNSFDEICSTFDIPENGQVDIKINKPNIHIFDNGPGMSRDELRRSMSKLGISSKPYKELTGFMGIGKFAGLSMSKEVRISSSKLGSSEKNWVSFDADEMLLAIEKRRSEGESKPIAETLKDHSRLNKTPAPEDPKSHYTAVHLLGIKDSYWRNISDRDTFLTKLGHVAPVKQDPSFQHSEDVENILQDISPEHYSPITVTVNGEQLYRPYYDEVFDPRPLEIVDEDGEQLAYGWTCLHTESEQIPNDLLRGIALFDRGIAIGDRKLPEELGLYSSSSTIIHFRWYLGELYLTKKNIQLTADRQSLRQTDETIQFIENSKREFKKLSRRAEKFSRRDNAEERAPKEISRIEDAKEDVESGNLSKELINHTVTEVASAREDLKYRVNYLEGDDKEEAQEAIERANDIISALTSSSDDEESEDIGNSDEGTESVTISEEEKSEVITIPDKVGFSHQEEQLFNLIVDAIADVSGGKDTNEFAEYYEAIEQSILDNYN